MQNKSREQCKVYGKLAINLTDNLAEGFHKTKREDCNCCLEYVAIKCNSLIFNCLCRNKNYDKAFSKNLSKGSKNTYRFCGRDFSKYCLMLQKGVYPYDNMDS